jgi:DNA-binding MarR family transcriptional regulator
MTTPRADETSASSGPGRAAALRIALRELRIELAIITRRVASAVALNDSDLDVLDVLALEGPQSPTVLARRMGIHAATMTGVLTRLERAGWVLRRRDLADRRSVQVESTGFDRLTEIYRDANQRVDDIAAHLSAEDTAVILDYLHRVGAAVHEASLALTGALAPERGLDR